jgi:hypothetical protein
MDARQENKGTGISRKRRWVGYGRTGDSAVGTTYGTVRTADVVVYTMRSARVCGAKLAGITASSQLFSRNMRTRTDATNGH